MIVTHKTTIHGECPNGGWDYYEVSFSPVDFIEVEQLEKACDRVRGRKLFQEFVAAMLASELKTPGVLVVTGRHGLNTDTRVEIKVEGK